MSGGLNEVLTNDEHLGPSDRGERQMRLFRECLEDCQLVDLGFCGPKFTWNNRQHGENNIRVRLDRGIANGLFIQYFEDIQVENIVTSSSDHYAVCLSFSKQGEARQAVLKRNFFRYEEAWNRAEDYVETVEKTWAEASTEPRSLQSIWNNLSKLAVSLEAWSKDSFGVPHKEIRTLEKCLSWLRNTSDTRTYSDEEKDIEKRLCELFEREEIMARQRSRVDWLKAGDRNTSFFPCTNLSQEENK